MRKYLYLLIVIAAVCVGVIFAMYKKNNTSLSYYRKPKRAKHVYVVNIKNSTIEEIALAVSLQGIVAKDKAEIYLMPGGNTPYREWLEMSRKSNNQTSEELPDVWALLDKYKHKFKDYVLFDYQDNSYNIATSIAGIKNYLMVEESIKSKMDELGFIMKEDVRGKKEQWAYETYKDMYAKDIVFEQNGLWEYPTEGMVGHGNAVGAVRDYAIFNKAFTFYERTNGTFRKQVLSDLIDDSPVIGWGNAKELGEDGMVRPISEASDMLVASAYVYNYTYLSSVNTKRIKQKNREEALPEEENVHYVTFLFTDGDNASWNINERTTSNKWWASPYRGKFSVGWSIMTPLIDLAPVVIDWYYANASNTQKVKDDFVVYGGNGYMYPIYYSTEARELNAARLSEYMGRMDINVMAAIDKKSFNKSEVWEPYLKQPNIKGAVYLDYSSYHLYNGAINWFNDKPLISARYSLWDKIQDEAFISRNINNASTDIHSPNAYSIVMVHCWSKFMEDINKLNGMFGSQVRVVDPDTFVRLVTQNVPHKNSDVLGSEENTEIVANENTLLIDMFESDNRSWSYDAKYWSIKDGVMKAVVNGDEQKENYAIAGDEQWNDYVFSAQLKSEGETSDTGMAFRMLDTKNLYLLAIKASKLILYKKVDNKYTQLETAPVGLSPEQWNRFTVSVKGNEITVLKDTVVVMKFADDTFTKGKIGLRLVAYKDKKVEIAFDNIHVYKQ